MNKIMETIDEIIFHIVYVSDLLMPVIRPAKKISCHPLEKVSN
jgi:hypothetical protein